MKRLFSTCLIAICLSASVASADTVSLTRDLKLGDRGSDVTALQKLLNVDSDTRIGVSGAGSPGFESDYFGSLTKAAVVKFQYKYRTEVLYPAGLFAPTGYVGAMTRAKLTRLAMGPVQQETSSIPAKKVSTNPVVYSVSPTRAQRGETITITGANFSSSGNTVILGDGPITQEFNNLPSIDGKTITFVYTPPIVQTMTASEIRVLPNNLGLEAEAQIKAKGLTLEDVVTPYKGIRNEGEFRDILANNKSLTDDSLYHFFWVTVKNANGTGSSQTALLHGTRKFPIYTAVNPSAPLFSSWGSHVVSLLEGIVPVANAQMSSGGFYTLAMVCTCSGAMVTFNTPVGFMVWQPGMLPAANSCRGAGGWLGQYITSAGTCMMYAGITCISLTFNLPIAPLFGCST